MRYLLAILLPWLSFFTMGKIFQGILCLILHDQHDRLAAGGDLGGYFGLEL